MARVGWVLAAALVMLACAGTEHPAKAAVLADPSIETACTGTPGSASFTLTMNCDTTATLTVPDGWTINGNGFTITAHDPTAGNFLGPVLTNAGTTMTIDNLTIQGTGFAVDCQAAGLYGIFFNDASGTVSNVHVLGITQHSGCFLGLAIRANGITAPRTVTITNTVVSDYQRGGLVASGSMTMNVSGSTIGPPDALSGVVAQNGVQYSNTAVGSSVGASGTITTSTIYGSGDQAGGSDGTAVLLYGAQNVTVSHNTITGAGTDIGIDVVNGSTGITLSYNAIGRTSPDSPDPTGTGILVQPPSAAALVCNTFAGWETTINGGIQVECLPLDVAETCHAYTPTILTATGGTPPYEWRVESGSLPPGLTLDIGGDLGGTPTKTGTYHFVAGVSDATGLTASQSFTLTVRDGCRTPPPPTTTTTTIPPTHPGGSPPPAPTAPETGPVPVTG